MTAEIRKETHHADHKPKILLSCRCLQTNITVQQCETIGGFTGSKQKNTAFCFVIHLITTILHCKFEVGFSYYGLDLQTKKCVDVMRRILVIDREVRS